MRDLPPLDGEVEELDGRGLCAIPGLVDCHTHACFAGDRVEEFSLRAARRELRGAARGRRRHPLDGPRDAGGRRGGLRAAVERHRAWMLATGTTTFEAKSGYGLDRDTELAQLRAIAAAGGVPTWLGAHAVPPEFDDADAYLDFALAEVLPEAAQLAEAADVFLERGAFDAAQARRYLDACREPGSRSACTATSSRRPARSRSRSSSARARSTTSRRPAGRRPGARRERRRRRAAARERALPRPADAAGTRARRRRRRGRARHRLQPRQRVLREPAARLLARRDAAPSLAGRGARRLHRQRRPRARPRGPASAGSRRATTPTSSCSTRPTGATSPTTSAATSSPGGRRRASYG